MAQAIRLAKKGLWTTDPNPRVGCVIVRDNEIVGQGWHERAGDPHAEVYALQMAKDKARGATCYVTLEPCCHYGKTPPCTDALLNAGITRVVIANVDPNPLVSSKGIEQLVNAGIVVDTGILSEEAQKLNPGFCTRMQRGRPYVRCKLAMSLDGRTAMASGESQWITSTAARADVQALRARSSAIMTGAGTILSDDPRLTVREAELPTCYSPPPFIRQPLRVVIDEHLSIPTHSKILSQPGKTLVFTSTYDESIKNNLEKNGAEVIYLPSQTGGIDLVAMVQMLANDYEVNEVHLETGATLGGAMLRAGLIDELVIYMAPVLMGSKARSLFDLPNINMMSESIPLKVEDIRAVGNDWRITAKVDRHADAT